MARASTRTANAGAAFVPEAGSAPLPGYFLRRLRGRGGFADVWESDSPTGESVALKFMSSQNQASTARELRSLQAIQSLDHPNLLRIRQVWSMSGQIVIAMDLAEASLLDMLLLYVEEFNKLIELPRLFRYMHQIAEALDFLNARVHTVDGRKVGYQHGDVKPNNILLVKDVAKLADYGLASPMNGPNTPCPRHGTAEYAAPEVFQGYLTEVSDQFSFAVTYYVLRTGGFPFPPPPPREKLRNYQRPAPDVSLAEADEQPILLRALSAIPQARFPSCGEFIRRLLKANRLEAVQDPLLGLTIQPFLSQSGLRSQIIRMSQPDMERKPAEKPVG